MAGLSEDLAKVCQDLPDEKVGELLDFARFHHQRTQVEKITGTEDGDSAWERIINDP